MVGLIASDNYVGVSKKKSMSALIFVSKRVDLTGSEIWIGASNNKSISAFILVSINYRSDYFNSSGLFICNGSLFVRVVLS